MGMWKKTLMELCFKEGERTAKKQKVPVMWPLSTLISHALTKVFYLCFTTDHYSVSQENTQLEKGRHHLY